MKFFIGITTYQRVNYIGELIDSILGHANTEHEYHISINDDGSTDGTREYLRGLTTLSIKNITFRILYSNRKQVHHADNNLILHANSLEYDFGFMMDDDVLIIQKGWEDLYYNAFLDTGRAHLVHYCRNWGGARYASSPLTCQGAFWTFTKTALENIGFMDTETFGERGWGHSDFTARACRLGYNYEAFVLDAPYSSDFVKLRPREGYVFTQGYDEALSKAMAGASEKQAAVLDSSREYIPLQKSVINHFFDHVYVINLGRRPDRRMRMERVLAEAGVTDYEFFEAVDGGYRGGVWGCAESHLAVYRDIKAKSYQRPLILEDDIIFINDLHASLLSLYSIPDDWGLLYLGASDYNHVNCEVKSPYYVGKQVDGTFAYAVKGGVIDYIIRMAEDRKNMPIDTRLHTAHIHLNTYIAHPMTCIADLTGSDIRPDRDTESHAKLINWDLKLYKK